MGSEVHISEAIQLDDKPLTVYRCDRCGLLAYPYQAPDGTISPEPPDVDCGCYMGPRWVKGVWQKVALRVGGDSDV